jgi:predicted DNA-binding antitoxin AbrB/MazE fold protein
MTQVIAIYRNGIFQPLDPVKLTDDERVRLTIEPAPIHSHETWLATVRELQAKVIARAGPLANSTPEIAADRLR